MKKSMDSACCQDGGDCKCGRNPAVIITAIVVLGLIISFAILRDRLTNQQYRQVTVTGQGRITYQPDQATINLGVQVDKTPKAEDALNQLNAKVLSITNAIKALGITDADIKTNNYSLYTQYDFRDNVSVVSGYNANQQLAIKVKSLNTNKDLLAKVIAEATKAGANQVNGVNFEASNLEDLKQQARVLAIKDAEKKGVDLAKAAGVRLCKISGWYENFLSGPNPVPMMDYAKGGMGGGTAATPQINAADNELIMEIGMTYNIK
jgi:hypothetical protein